MARTDEVRYALGDEATLYLFVSFQCNAGESTNALYEMLYAPPVKHMILGPICSVEAEVQAQASHMWNISHVCLRCITHCPTYSSHQGYRWVADVKWL